MTLAKIKNSALPKRWPPKNGQSKYHPCNASTSAADEFEKSDRAGGKVVAGLLRRREAEEREFKAAQGQFPGVPPSAAQSPD
jgi:hypothetical protein